MTDILAWIATHWLIIGIVVAVVVFLVACLPWAAGWYLRRWVIQLHEEPGPAPAKGRAG